ncbi:MAG: hypothetical protein GY714_29655 [Desulfobacterales bacterium]|nr:hypothetical protein [Desulfobacterales bacterium]
MKKKSIIRNCILIFIVVAGYIIFQVHSTTRHLTETPPQEIRLHFGNNNLTFPVVRGSYLLRVGISGMEPATFRFLVKGKITTPSGDQSINETYKPTDEVLSKKINGGYIARYINIKENKGIVSAQLEVIFPEKETLVCLFHGIK